MPTKPLCFTLFTSVCVSCIDPLLLTGASDGSLRLHNASLWRHDVMVAGKRPRVSRSSLTEVPGHVDR